MRRAGCHERGSAAKAAQPAATGGIPPGLRDAGDRAKRTYDSRPGGAGPGFTEG